MNTDNGKGFRIESGQKFRIKDFDPAWRGGKIYENLCREVVKGKALATLRESHIRLSKAQTKLWADGRFSVLVVLQAMDAAGKDGMIKHVLSGINPQGCSVTSFKQPSNSELAHSYLWRIAKQVPPRGHMTVFNRSHYEDVLVTRVHPELLLTSRTEGVELEKNGSVRDPGKAFWKQRFTDINNFEQHLAENGTLILKFFLNISKAEQKRRFLDRIEDPAKQWKFAAGDVTERQFWKDYMFAYEDAITATSTDFAPWYIIPADHKYVARAVLADILADGIERLGCQWPKPSRKHLSELADARAALTSEP